MTKLKQLITLIGDVNLHLFHLDSWRCKQTGWFTLKPCTPHAIYPKYCSCPQSSAYPHLMRKILKSPKWKKSVLYIKRETLDVGLCGINIEIKQWNMIAWLHKTGSTLNFTDCNNSSPLLSSPLLLTSLLAHFPLSLMPLQQFVRLLWLITHLITTAESHRLSAVLMHYHCSGTLQAWSVILTGSHASNKRSLCDNWGKFANTVSNYLWEKNNLLFIFHKAMMG